MFKKKFGINKSVSFRKSLRDKLILLNGKKAKSSKKVLVGQQITYDEALFSKNKEYFLIKILKINFILIYSKNFNKRNSEMVSTQ